MSYPFTVVAIGSSAGGLAPLKEIISGLPRDIGAAIVVISHLSTQIPSNLHRILQKETDMPVLRVEDSAPLEPGNIYVMPEGRVMTVKDRKLSLRQRQSYEKINKAIDAFFLSMADDAREMGVGIILSGGGYDGIEGAKKIEKYNGIVIVQDPETAQFPLMPYSLIANDHPDYILTPDDIVDKIVERTDSVKLGV